MKRYVTRLLSALLALSLLMGLVPAALADEPEVLTGGSAPPAAAEPSPSPSPEPSPEVTPQPVPVSVVRLNKNNLSLNVGESAVLTAQVSPEEASNKTVTWSSDRPDVADVSGGTVTAKAPGTAVITVATDDGDRTDRCAVTVTQPVQPGVEVTPKSLTLAPGQSAALSAVTTPEGSPVVWSSSNPDVAVVDPATGRVTAKSPARQGTATITATFNYDRRNYSGSCVVTVTPAAAPTLPQAASVKVGQSTTLTVGGLPAGASVSWSGGGSALRLSSSSGASVTATGGQLSGASAVVPVTATVSYAGQTTPLTCRVTVSPGSVQEITYSGLRAGGEQAFRQQDFQTVCRAVFGYDLKSVTFRKVSGGELLYSGKALSLSNSTVASADLGRVSLQASAGSTGAATVSYDAVDTANNRYSGAVKLPLAAASGLVKYASPTGGAVLFSRGDFQSVCRSAAGGALDYVTFSRPAASKGVLYAAFDARAGRGTELRDRDACYDSPARGQIGLDTVAFVPAKDYEGAVSIPFTGRSTAGRSFSGTVEITVGSGRRGDVTYKVSVNGSVALDDADFSDLSRELTKSPLESIRFPDLPAAAKGTLYHQYGRPGQREAARNTSYCRTSAPYLDELTFVPAKDYEGTVSIPFTGRDTSGREFSGTLVVKVGSGLAAAVTLEADAGQPVRFDSEPFQRFCRDETGDGLDYLAFDWASGQRAGQLYYRYGRSGEKAAGSGKYYRTGDPALSDLTFVPGSAAGQSVRIPFEGRSTGGRAFSGALVIRYTALRAPDVVRYSSDGTAVAFRAADFTAACAARGGKPLASIRFTQPEGGGARLYYDYTGPARYRGTVSPAMDYGPGSAYPLDRVVLQPRAEFSGVVTIPYTGTDTAGGTYQGTIQVTVTPPAASSRFNDMGGYGWAVPGVEFLAAYGITNGTGTGATFSPAGTLTRCDYLLMLVRTFGFTSTAADNFSDVPAGSYYASALAAAKALGIAQAGPGNTFRPTDPVTRQDAMVFLYRAMEKAGRAIPAAQDSYLTRFPDGASADAAARPALAAMAQAGILKGDGAGRLNPFGTLTRAEMAVILHRGLTL